MIYSENYQLLINHKNYEIMILKQSKKILVYKVSILSKDKKNIIIYGKLKKLQKMEILKIAG